MPGRLRLAAAGLLLALGLAACGGGGSETTSEAATTQAGTSNVAAAAAEKTRAAGSSKVSFTTSLTLPGQSQPIEISGEGAFDYGKKQGTLTLDFGAVLDQLGAGALGGGDTTVEVVFTEGAFYMKLPEVIGQVIGGGKPWIKFDLAKLAGAGGGGLGQLAQAGGNDPSQYLAFLAGATQMQEVGTDTVRGVETTHYTATVDLARVLQAAPAASQAQLGPALDQLEKQLGSKTLPVDVWIDGDGLIRKLVMTYNFVGTSASKSTVTLELYDFGTEVSVEAPPADQVVDASELSGLLGGGETGTTTTP